MIASGIPVRGSLGSTDKCRSCDAWIAWAKTTSGKATPVDLDPVEDGNLLITHDDLNGYKAFVLGPLDVPIAGDRYVTHFSSCPSAASHRGRRRGR